MKSLIPLLLVIPVALASTASAKQIRPGSNWTTNNPASADWDVSVSLGYVGTQLTATFTNASGSSAPVNATPAPGSTPDNPSATSTAPAQTPDEKDYKGANGVVARWAGSPPKWRPMVRDYRAGWGVNWGGGHGSGNGPGNEVDSLPTFTRPGAPVDWNAYH